MKEKKKIYLKKDKKGKTERKTRKRELTRRNTSRPREQKSLKLDQGWLKVASEKGERLKRKERPMKKILKKRNQRETEGMTEFRGIGVQRKTDRMTDGVLKNKLEKSWFSDLLEGKWLKEKLLSPFLMKDDFLS